MMLSRGRRSLRKRLLRNAWASKAQLLAIVATVFLGLVAYVSLRVASDNMESALARYYEDHRFAHFFVDLQGMPAGALRKLASAGGIVAVEGRVCGDVLAEMGRSRRPVVRIISYEVPQVVNRLYLYEGRLPEKGDSRAVAVISKFAEANGLKVGDPLPVVVRGEVVPLQIAAVVDSPEFVYAVRDTRNILPDNENFGVAFMPAAAAQSLLGLRGQVNNLVLLIEEGVDLEAFKDVLEERLERYGLKQVIERKDQISHSMIRQELDGLTQFSTVIPLIFLGISAITIFLMISRTVESDRVSIGILKALGYGDRDVILHYGEYGMIIALLGSVPGVLLGRVLGFQWCRLYAAYYTIPLLEVESNPRHMLAGLAGTFVLCSLTALAAAFRATAISPAEAMRRAAPRAGGRLFLEGWKWFWAKLHFTWKMILRNSFRNKRRLAITVVGVAMTYSVVFLPISVMGMFDFMMDRQFSEIEIFDYAVSFNKPLSRDVLPDLRRLAGSKVAEPIFDLPVTLRSGWKERTAVVRGLPKDTLLYRFEDPDGRPVNVPAGGVLISEYLAGALGVGKGSRVEIASHYFGEKKTEVVVAGVVRQYLGSGCYMSLEQVEAITGRKGLMTGALLEVPEGPERDGARFVLEEAPNIEAVHSNRDIMSAYESMMGVALQSILIEVILGCVLGFAILFNISVISVSERLREFSTLRVMGFSRAEVFSIILKENVVAFVLGALVGLPLARQLYLGMVEQFGTELALIPRFVLPAAYVWAFLTLVCFFGAVMAAVWLRVRKLDFLEALKTRLT